MYHFYFLLVPCQTVFIFSWCFTMPALMRLIFNTLHTSSRFFFVEWFAFFELVHHLVLIWAFYLQAFFCKSEWFDQIFRFMDEDHKVYKIFFPSTNNWIQTTFFKKIWRILQFWRTAKILVVNCCTYDMQHKKLSIWGKNSFPEHSLAFQGLKSTLRLKFSHGSVKTFLSLEQRAFVPQGVANVQVRIC